MVFLPKGYINWNYMPNYSMNESFYINDFHRQNSMAAQREVALMSLQPCSREQKLQQVAILKEASRISKQKL